MKIVNPIRIGVFAKKAPGVRIIIDEHIINWKNKMLYFIELMIDAHRTSLGNSMTLNR